VFLRCGIILFDAIATDLKYLLRRGCRFLVEDLQEDNRIRINAIDNSPRDLLVANAQFVASRANRWHGPGLWQTQFDSLLKLAKQKTSLDSGFLGKWGSLYAPN